MVSILNDDLLVEILTRLPLKSLSRLKSVSKAWHRLISHDCIRGQHPLLISGVFHHSKSSHHRYASVSGSSFTESDLSRFPFRSSSNSILVDVSNGLLLFARGNTFYVCNPVTNRWVLLPTPSKWPLISVLAFDPYRSPHYKVVSVTVWKTHGAHLEVFSSQSGTWVEQEIYWDGVHTDAISTNMRYFEGTLHILAHPRYMVRLDLEKMTCGKMELPAILGHWACVGILGGQVSYAASEGDGVRVWAVKDDNWVLKDRFIINCGFNLLGLDPEREVVYVWMVEGKVVRYDMGKKKFDGEWDLKGEMEGANFKRSLAFPCSRYLLDCMTVLE